jgi:hypothetical protein
MRPLPITLLSIFCFGAATYLAAIAATMLVRWDVFSFIAGAPLMAGFETAGPWAFLLAAAVYALAGFGLWELHNWARHVAIGLAALHAILALPKVSENAISLSIPRLALTGLPVIVAAALIFYLSKPSTVSLFQQK